MKAKNFSYAAIALLAISSIALAQVQEITSEVDYDDIVKNNKKVVAKFAMKGCPACEMVEQPYKDLSEDPVCEDTQFLHIDVHAVRSLAGKHQITGAPTFIYLADGKKAGSTVGAPRNFAERIKADMTQAFGSASDSSVPGNIVAHNEAPYAPNAGNGVKVELPKLDEPQMKAEGSMPSEPAPSSGGVMGMITDLINAIISIVKQIIDIIIGIITSIINAIKGMFSRS